MEAPGKPLYSTLGRRREIPGRATGGCHDHKQAEASGWEQTAPAWTRAHWQAAGSPALCPEEPSSRGPGSLALALRAHTGDCQAAGDLAAPHTRDVEAPAARQQCLCGLGVLGSCPPSGFPGHPEPGRLPLLFPPRAVAGSSSGFSGQQSVPSRGLLPVRLAWLLSEVGPQSGPLRGHLPVPMEA